MSLNLATQAGAFRAAKVLKPFIYTANLASGERAARRGNRLFRAKV
jgi:hypothetical protein